MAPISGVDGKVYVDEQEVADVRTWSARFENEVKTYASSSTSGWERTAAGNKRWTFSMTVYNGDGSLNLGFSEGDLVTVKGYAADGKYFQGSVRIQTVEPEVDIESAELISCTVSGAGDGQYTMTG